MIPSIDPKMTLCLVSTEKTRIMQTRLLQNADTIQAPDKRDNGIAALFKRFINWIKSCFCYAKKEKISSDTLTPLPSKTTLRAIEPKFFDKPRKVWSYESNIAVWENTYAFLKEQIKDGATYQKEMTAAVEKSALFNGIAEDNSKPKFDDKIETKTFMCQADIVDLGIALKKQGANVAILNPAATHPGGGYKSGHNALEETYCRRSNLSLAIDKSLGLQKKDFYKAEVNVASGAAILSPDVLFLKKGRDQNYAPLDKPIALTVISSAAARKPKLKEDNTYKDDSTRKGLEKQIYNQLYAAREGKIDTLIFTAFGCGAFGHPPKEVSAMYQKVINESFPNTFKSIYFAIIDDHNTGKAHNPQGNYAVFKDTFGAKEVTLEEVSKQQ